MIENRVHTRIDASFPVTCEVRGVEIQAKALNISRGGLLITAADSLTVGSLVKLRFTVGSEPIEIKGYVRHSVQEKGCGVEFIEVLPSLQVKLAAYLEAAAKSA